MIKITLKKIKDKNPCKDGWEKILEAQGPDMDREWPLSDALKSNCLSDVLWALRCLPENENLWRKYAVWCARQVQHLMKDDRSIEALDVAWAHSEGKATDQQLVAAWVAAWAAARGAAWAAAGDAARGAAWDAAKDAQTQKLIQILDAGEWVE